MGWSDPQIHSVKEVRASNNTHDYDHVSFSVVKIQFRDAIFDRWSSMEIYTDDHGLAERLTNALNVVGQPTSPAKGTQQEGAGI